MEFKQTESSCISEGKKFLILSFMIRNSGLAVVGQQFANGDPIIILATKKMTIFQNLVLQVVYKLVHCLQNQHCRNLATEICTNLYIVVSPPVHFCTNEGLRVARS